MALGAIRPASAVLAEIGRSIAVNSPTTRSPGAQAVEARARLVAHPRAEHKRGDIALLVQLAGVARV